MLRCPCMPQCPNYGKCRQCIAAHAAYYTVPHCIKIMQNEMKRNHLHPTNPHIKKSLAERVEDYYAAHPDAHLRTAAEDLSITQWQLLDAMPTARPVPLSDLGAVYQALQTLERVKLHVDTGPLVLQLTMPLPPAPERMGVRVMDYKTGETDATALLFGRDLYALFLVRERLCGGKESLSVALVGEDEKIALSIYLCRAEDNTIEEPSKMVFETLWNKYKP